MPPAEPVVVEPVVEPVVVEPAGSARFVVDDEALWPAVAALAGRRVVALTGAGMSTASGIPDYRGPLTRQKARNPVRFAQFVGDERARRRYWARATLGWPRIRDAVDNDAHRALAALETRGRLTGVITQNVDRLHTKAGSRRVVELHGALRDVGCLACGHVVDRDDVQARLIAANPGFLVVAAAAAAAQAAPDGDVDLHDGLVDDFVVVACARCGGALKPRVVYFGENVAADVVAAARALGDDADALLVAGTSLEVYSGRRFVDAACARGIPVVIVNRGPTRSDDRATVKIEGDVVDVLVRLARAVA
ncbi:MAG: NAD-dependent protein deacetylase [Deltaproteobacteria bacterium]|nr:NAD-dependent protein deacetylase [Deltaproteobacteria bacterium]